MMFIGLVRYVFMDGLNELMMVISYNKRLYLRNLARFEILGTMLVCGVGVGLPGYIYKCVDYFGLSNTPLMIGRYKMGLIKILLFTRIGFVL